jgi:hypothetical protein
MGLTMAGGSSFPFICAVFLPHRFRPSLRPSVLFGQSWVLQGPLQDPPHLLIFACQRWKMRQPDP